MNQTSQKKNYSEITPEISRLSEICVQNNTIDQEFYSRYEVFRGLRDLDGNGVLTGLTEFQR
jgi:citrate synthase